MNMAKVGEAAEGDVLLTGRGDGGVELRMGAGWMDGWTPV